MGLLNKKQDRYERIKKLKEKSQKFYSQGKLEKALSCYQELVDLDKKNIRTQIRIGEILKKLGRKQDAIATFKSIAETYAKEGLLIQAISICKILLALDPKDQSTKKLLVNLYADRGMEAQGKEEITTSGPVTPATAPTPISSANKPLGIDPQGLPKIPLFSHLGREEFQEVIDRLTIADFEDQTLICQEGQLADSMYIIVDGNIRVQIGDKNGQPIDLAELKPGDFFGEIALFTHSPRTANCVSKGKTQLLQIRRQDFQILIQKYPRVKNVLNEFYKTRVLDTLLVKSDIFGSISPEIRKQIASRFVPQEFIDSEYIVKEGEFGDCMYLIRDGTVEVLTIQNGKQVHLAHLRSGDFFGEVTLLKQVKRTATVQARGACDLMRLDRENFQWIISKYPEMEKIIHAYVEKRVHSTLQMVKNK